MSNSLLSNWGPSLQKSVFCRFLNKYESIIMIQTKCSLFSNYNPQIQCQIYRVSIGREIKKTGSGRIFSFHIPIRSIHNKSGNRENLSIEIRWIVSFLHFSENISVVNLNNEWVSENINSVGDIHVMIKTQTDAQFWAVHFETWRIFAASEDFFSYIWFLEMVVTIRINSEN